MNFRECLFLSLGERIRSIAIRTTQVAGGEANENARQTGEGAFALQTQVNFVDDKRIGHAKTLTDWRRSGRLICLRTDRGLGLFVTFLENIIGVPVNIVG